ncbi:response regulator transcription factor [Paenibacillus gansuensis]|uniref:Response regulator n=1 Tax=Paenibacillus gansuensis TaxID=306542 RepID=A0ABW5PCW8_9BACL
MYRVLIVDDEPIIRQSLAMLVGERHDLVADIRTAENGLEAMETMEKDTPDFVFTDIRMPKMDGIELCRQVSQLGMDLQIVVVSGYGDFEYARQCMSYGVKEYLLKPVSRDKVHHILEKLASVMQKQNLYSCLSITRLEDLADQIEEAIWSLRKDVLAELLDGWHAELCRCEVKPKQKMELLRELYCLLVKRLNGRDVYLFEAKAGCLEGEGIADAYDTFREALDEVCVKLQAKRKGYVKDPVEESKLYIESHLAKESSLEEVAEMLGLNPSYFSQLFKQSTGETFVQYRIRRRMEKAKKLLQLPHYRITDITYEVGYADHPHFTKTFKKYTGLSPTEFRHSLGMDC